jgi:hypothetical protein
MWIGGTNFYLLTACATIELLMFCWLCSLGQEAFREFVWTNDAFDYHRIALQLAHNATLITSDRTLGYPLFLSFGYLIGGRSYGIYVVIATQLILNILFTWVCWRLLQRTAPDAGVELRAIVTLFFFWAGMGMALYLMTDFLASFFFGVFLYGMLFWRTRSSVALSGTSLAFATMTRPTFTLIPFLIPFAAYLIRRVTSKVPLYHIIAFIISAFVGTGISTAYQYIFNSYLGPSPIFSPNYQRAIYFSLNQKYLTESDHIKIFEAEIERRAGQPFLTISRSNEEKYAKQIFLEALISHPGRIIFYVAKNFVKYIFVPVESIIARLTALYLSEQTYLTYLRPIIGLLCLPIWLLSLSPPIGSPKGYKIYYLFLMMFLFYVLGLSAMTPLQGERMRFPVLIFMLPVMVWNIHSIHGYLSRRLTGC